MSREAIALLDDLSKLAAVAMQADGTIAVSLDHFSLIREAYKAR